MIVSIDNSQISGSTTGIFVNTPNGSSAARLNVNNSTIFNNATGINGTGNFSRTFVNNSAIYRNTTGLVVSAGAQDNSFGNNQLVDNTTPGAFTLPLLTPN